MAIKKSELYSSLWASCDELRGGMDASQYKDYVLVMLFIKYVSDKYAGVPYAPIEIPDGAGFKDMVALKGKPDIGDQINKKIIAPLAAANKLPTADFPDFNDPYKLGGGKEMVDRLTNLIAIFERPDLNFSRNRAEGDDLLGDAYEYLMRHFATESGKSKGQFYTPAEVSRIMAQIIGIKEADTSNATTVYDPTCGSGSLLLKVADEAGTDVTLYGQEKDVATAGLARMNMILHNYPTAEIIGGASTLADPKYKEGEALKTFDYVVANPPFSDKRWGTGFNPDTDQFDRFKGFGVPPAKQGDYAYLLHIVRSLKSTGKGACILPHGVLFRGNAEAEIRRNLIRRRYIKAIIGLPPNLFYGTGIPACIVLVDKEGAQARKGIFMVDASQGFMKDGPKNRLRAQDIHRIVDAFTKRAEIPKFCRMVPFEEIENNEFNLNLARYIDSSEPEDIQDLEGHLRGGIPESDIEALSKFWEIVPSLRSRLFWAVENRPQSENGFPDGYFETHFTADAEDHVWPNEFAIVTACETTGECWTEEQNCQADRDLDARLRSYQAWMTRLTGFSPWTGHSEPGWAVALPFELACDIGQDFKQVAIFYVKSNKLGVSFCDDRRSLVNFGQFSNRLCAQVNAVLPRPNYAVLAVQKSRIKQTIFEHPEFTSFVGRVSEHFQVWRDRAAAQLKHLETGFHPKDEVVKLSEDLLARFKGTDLLDPYAIYQHLMDYWVEVMQDDFYIVAADGWKAETYRILETKKGKDGKPDKVTDKGWTCDLIPKSLLVAHFFEAEQSNIDELQVELEALTAEIEQLEADQSGEDGLFSELDSVNAANVRALLKGQPTLVGGFTLEEQSLLELYVGLSAKLSAVKQELKAAIADLDRKSLTKYSSLSVDEVKGIVVDDKWLAAILDGIQTELIDVSQKLAHRVNELAERYMSPLPDLTSSVVSL